jgi:hypothetical protein
MAAKDLILAKKAQAEAEVLQYDAIVSELDLDLKAAEDKGFDLGVAQAGIPAGDKIYTEADLQAELAIKQALIDAGLEKIAALEVKVVELENAQDFKVAQFKAQLKNKYEEMQVIENQAETGFADLLV